MTFQERSCTKYEHVHALKMSLICAVMRKWICKVVTFASQASDLTTWTKQPFSDLIALESSVLGLATKGMSDRDEQLLVATFKGK